MFLRALATVTTMSLVLVGCANTSSEDDWTTDTPTSPTSSADAGAASSEDSGNPSEEATADDGPLTPTARGEIGRLRVSVPDAWEETVVEDQLFSLRYLLVPGDDASPTLSLAGDFGDYRTARVGLSTLIAEVQIGTPGFHVEKTTDIEVPGATSAVRLDFVYGTEEDSGTFQGMWIVASDEETSQSVAVTVSGPTEEDALLDEVQDEVQDSMTLLEP